MMNIQEMDIEKYEGLTYLYKGCEYEMTGRYVKKARMVELINLTTKEKVWAEFDKIGLIEDKCNLGKENGSDSSD